MLLEQWRRYTELFHLRETVLQSVGLVTQSEEDGDEPAFVLVKGVVSFNGVFTHEGVSMIFPSAKRDPVLMLRVLGQKMVWSMVFHLYFNAHGQLVRHDAEADFFTAVRRALGGDCDTAFRFMDALRLGQESMLGPIVEEEEEEEGQTTAESQSSVGSDSGDGDVCSSVGDQEPEDEANFESRSYDDKLKDTAEEGTTAMQRHSLAFLLSNVDS